MNTPADREHAERLGCRCVLFITEADGTRPGTIARCLEHKRIARANFVDN